MRPVTRLWAVGGLSGHVLERLQSLECTHLQSTQKDEELGTTKHFEVTPLLEVVPA